MIRKFKKKPVEIEAEQFVIWHLDDIPQSIMVMNVTYPIYKDKKGPYIIIPTSEGNMRCSDLDWIIKEPFPSQGREYYPCNADKFYKTYDDC